MSKASQITVLCEDRPHDVFAKRFLKKGWGISGRHIRVIPYPEGRGSGKKHVQAKLADEVRAFRSRDRRASTILLVFRDADEDSVQKAKAVLDGKLESGRKANERIVYINPKWHIETWIAYLDGVSVDEEEKRKYKDKYEKMAESSACHPLIDALASKCRKKELLDSPRPSLTDACEEFERVRDAL